MKEFAIVPCDCGSLNHAIVCQSSRFGLLIRFPLECRDKNPFVRVRNIWRNEFVLGVNTVIDAIYFPLVEYLWKICFPNKPLSYEVLDGSPHWKLFWLEVDLKIKPRLSMGQIVEYLLYGYVDYQLEILIDEDGIASNRYETIY